MDASREVIDSQSNSKRSGATCCKRILLPRQSIRNWRSLSSSSSAAGACSAGERTPFPALNTIGIISGGAGVTALFFWFRFGLVYLAHNAVLDFAAEGALGRAEALFRGCLGLAVFHARRSVCVSPLWPRFPCDGA